MHVAQRVGNHRALRAERGFARDVRQSAAVVRGRAGRWARGHRDGIVELALVVVIIR
ncbi:hypothetical protein D3C83_115430 [compost metagenome]